MSRKGLKDFGKLVKIEMAKLLEKTPVFFRMGPMRGFYKLSRVKWIGEEKRKVELGPICGTFTVGYFPVVPARLSAGTQLCDVTGMVEHEITEMLLWYLWKYRLQGRVIPLSRCLSVSLSLSLSHTHTHTHTRSHSHYHSRSLSLTKSLLFHPASQHTHPQNQPTNTFFMVAANIRMLMSIL